MAINFPTNPNNGDVHAGFTYNSTKSVWESVAPSMMPTSDTPPTSPSDGQMWFDTDGGGAFVYYEDTDSAQWVEVIGSAGADGAAGPAGADGSAAVYATVDDLPGTASAGDQAFVTANNRLYLWNGSGWYNIALINTTPSISGAASSYNLAIDGTPTVVTITATDPEGLPITYSIASDTSGNIATVTSNNNVFTITPSTNTADAGSFSLTFRASDGVNIASAISSFTLQFSVENSNYTTALITSVGTNNAVNNSFVDSSTNSHTITAAGNATQTTFSPYRHGGYSMRTTAGTSLNIPASTDNQFTGDFTIEGWVYSLDTGDKSFYVHGSYFAFNVNFGGGFNIYLNSGGPTFSPTDIVPAANEWNHVALVRSGSTVSVYLNGVASATTATNSATLGYNSIAYIGGLGTQAGGSVNGYIADCRVVNGSAVYTSNFTPPTERLTAITNTSVLTCHLPYIADGSTNNKNLTSSGTLSTEPFSPFDYIEEYTAASHGGSAFFDGSGDYLTVASGSHFADFGTGDFTIEWWEYITGWPSQYFSIVHYGALGDTSNFTSNIGIRYEGSGAHIRIGASGSYVDFTGLTTPLNVWRHCAIVRSGTTATLYRNGKVDGSATLSNNITQGGQSIIGGAYFGGGSGSLYSSSGFINDLRVVKNSTVYTSAFTPPTAPLTAITNTSLLFSGTNAGIIDKSQSSSQLILDGDTKCSSTQTKYRSTAIYTDGTGDRVRFGINNKNLVCDWGVGGEPFTVEWWMYDTQPYTAQHSFGPQTGGGAGAWNSSTGHQWITYWNNSVLNIYYYGTNGTYNGNTCTASQLGIVQNQWQHIAHTYDGTTWRLYVDGVHGFHWVLPNQPANVSGTYAALGSFAEAAYYTAAYYDDVRITKGLARYTGTSSFTPPAEALKG